MFYDKGFIVSPSCRHWQQLTPLGYFTKEDLIIGRILLFYLCSTGRDANGCKEDEDNLVKRLSFFILNPKNQSSFLNILAGEWGSAMRPPLPRYLCRLLGDIPFHFFSLSHYVRFIKFFSVRTKYYTYYGIKLTIYPQISLVL